MSESKLNEAISNYYKLKENYDVKINEIKLKINSNTRYTLAEKAKAFKQMKKCINCKQDGGTLFTNKDGILKAVCGNIDKPCDLHIEIDKGKYKLSNELLEELNKKINKLKIDIIKIKLDYLFGYISESDALAKFNTLKEELNRDNDLFKKVEMFYINIAENPEDETRLKILENDFFVKVNKIKDICKIFMSTNNNFLLKAVADNYVGEILPLSKEISDLKYIFKDIEKSEDIFYLIEKHVTLKSLEYTLEEGKILFNNKK